jgi:hypothetical protein
MSAPVCAHCKFPLGNEPFLKIDERIYHQRCWDRARTAVKNKREQAGNLVCPQCSLPIRTGDGTAFREGYAFHVPCAPEPV